MTQYIVSNNELFIRKTELEDLNYVLQAEQDPESKKFILSWSREQHERAISNRFKRYFSFCSSCTR
jgi:hypothetical protein